MTGMAMERELYSLWLDNTGNDPEAQAELEAIRDNDEEITDRFYRELSFGTAGLRGILGMGTNRMNIYTVGRATQGFAQFLQAEVTGAPTVAIAYDSRRCSELFARHAAGVFAGNGVKVYLYHELMPTPALSFAVRELSCDGGVVITASHNPAEYNGYKTYGPDGCQIGPDQAEAVQREIGDTDMFAVKYIPFEQACAAGLVEFIPDDFVSLYINRVYEHSPQPRLCAEAGLKVVYTPLNGAGKRCVMEIFEQIGLRDVQLVPEQAEPNGNFPTCPYPNPEMPEALELGLQLAQREDADILIATDPDCDRVAAAVRSGKEWRILTGNEVGVLLLDYICTMRAELGDMPKKPVAVKSIVSTRLADAVAAHHGVELRVVPTGFKFIGEEIADLEERGQAERFVFGFEESCGYLSGAYVRDKDAVNAAALLVECASWHKVQERTLVDALHRLYEDHGVYLTEVGNYSFGGAAGMQKMNELMQQLREHPPEEVAGDAVAGVTDYQASMRSEMGRAIPVDFPRSNMMQFDMDNGNSIIVRPSGTEPKIKAYFTVLGQDLEKAGQRMENYRAAFEHIAGVD